MESRFSLYAALSVVVANMIGTGVFTSLGFQLVDIRSGPVLLSLWVVGGIAAFCGAVTYAELGASIPRSGGEYIFLSRIYHPAAGFVSGWISATIGFAAPTALAAITFGTYLASVFPALSSTLLAIGLVVILSVVHATTRRNSSRVQRVTTTVKVILIVAFCIAAVALVDDPQFGADAGTPGAGMLSPAFAVALIFVSYAFSGWNAATYLTSELENPNRTLPIALAGGTLLVTVLYVGLNFAFLYAAPAEAMVGRIEVGYVAAGYIFGERGADLMGITLALLLISTVSAMVLAGPRVLHSIGEDYAAFRLLQRTNERGIPSTAIYVQAALTLLFILTGSFETILVFSGFTMGLNTLLAAIGVFVFRRREPDVERPYRAWLYPVTPLVFVALTGWTLLYILRDRPLEAGLGLGLVVVGLGIYWVTRTRGDAPSSRAS